MPVTERLMHMLSGVGYIAIQEANSISGDRSSRISDQDSRPLPRHRRQSVCHLVSDEIQFRR